MYCIISEAISDYLIYLKSLKFDTEPDYKKIRSIFTFGVKEGRGSVGTPLQFSISKTPSKRTRTPLSNSKTKKTKSVEEQELHINGDETPKPRKKGRPKKEVHTKPVYEMEQVSLHAFGFNRPILQLIVCKCFLLPFTLF